jgi:hypothetical protein
MAGKEEELFTAHRVVGSFAALNRLWYKLLSPQEVNDVVVFEIESVDYTNHVHYKGRRFRVTLEEVTDGV